MLQNQTRPFKRLLFVLAAGLLLTSVIGQAGQLDSGAFKPVIDEITQSGFQTSVARKGEETISGLPEKYRIKTTFEGPQKDTIRFSAFDIQPAQRPHRALER